MKSVLVLICLLLVNTLFCQSTDFRVKQFNLDDGVAIKGYDPVAYFVQNRAVKGKKELSYDYHGVNYHFSSLANQQAFQLSPEKYEPQYGGWCAYAMGHD